MEYSKRKVKNVLRKRDAYILQRFKKPVNGKHSYVLVIHSEHDGVNVDELIELKMKAADVFNDLKKVIPNLEREDDFRFGFTWNDLYHPNVGGMVECTSTFDLSSEGNFYTIDDDDCFGKRCLN